MHKPYKILLSPPHQSGLEQEYIKRAFDSNYLAPSGSNINEFELQIENLLENKKKAIALNSGTASIHLALKLLNIQKDDVVLCQSKTFVATANPIYYLGAKPIFIDSETDTWNMCPDLLEKAINDCLHKGIKPKAIITVCLYGMPYKVKEIHEIAKNHNIPIIEDAAEALGSQYQNRLCGTFGDYGVYSFNSNKIITTSCGGALLVNNEEEKKRVIYLATQAKLDTQDYSHNELGYNYRLSNVLAGIGIGQFKALENYVTLRRRNFEFYQDKLRHLTEISFLPEAENIFSNRWLTCILFESEQLRNSIKNKLQENAVESRISWKPLHLQPLFKNCKVYINGNSENYYSKGLCLPSGSNLREENLEYITNIIISAFN